MKKFLLTGFIFLLPIILTSYFVDLLISKNLKKSNSYAQKEYSTWNAIVDGKLNSEILIYGSSRAWTHFDTKIIEDSLKQRTYNLGIDGSAFKLQNLRHVLALKNNTKPKLIIYSVDAWTIQEGNLYNSDQFLPYMLWDKNFFNYTSKYEGFNYFDYKIPLIRYYGKFEAIKTAIQMIISPNNNIVERIKGYQGQTKPWNNDFENAKNSITKFVIKSDKHIVELFDNYLKECKEQNIEVILVYSPIFIEGQEFLQNQKQVINTFEILAKNNDFLFMNFSKDEICFDKKYFYNSTHLNKTGAELFTKKLCNQMKNISTKEQFGAITPSVQNRLYDILYKK